MERQHAVVRRFAERDQRRFSRQSTDDVIRTLGQITLVDLIVRRSLFECVELDEPVFLATFAREQNEIRSGIARAFSLEHCLVPAANSRG